jgi:pilus assembly protein CpaB
MKTVISIVLILVGIVGIYFVSQSGNEVVIQQVPVSENTQPEITTERIMVAVAKRDLANKTVLTNDDFELTEMTVEKTGSEKPQFSLQNIGNNIINWAITSPVQAGSTIPVSLLVKPGTTEYISMFLQPGSVIYSFTVAPADYYIFDNLKVGEYVDVYLAFDRNPASGDIISPGNRPNITDIRLKPIMMEKRVLAISPSLAATKKKRTNANQTIDTDGDDRIVVELTDQDLKVLKALEDKAKFVVFPSIPSEVLEERENARLAALAAEENSENADGSSAKTDRETQNWPISNEEIFNSTTVKRIEG